jgi:protein-disulfide isomerase
MSNRFVLILIACIVAFGGIFWFSKHKNQSTTNNSAGNAQPTNHVRGGNSKKVVLIEYGDYQCPACGQYYPLLKEVEKKYGQDISFQFRNFPLSQIHQNAMAGARAAEAASNQNKFWEMHDALYDSQKQWESLSDPSSFFEQLAQQLNLDMTKYKQDFASAQVNAVINADINEATKIGANSTPTFVINGKKVEENPRDLDGFGKLIEQAAQQNK